jgi:hypothetical protein
MGETHMEGNAKGDANPLPPGTVARGIALLALVTLLGVWSWSHLGMQLRVPAALAGLTAAFAVGGRIVDWLFGRHVLEAARAAVRSFLARRVTWPALVATALLLVLGSGFITSIAIEPEDGEQGGSIKVAPAAPGADARARVRAVKQPVERFLVLTLPWGRDFVVGADGYVARTVATVPLVPRRVRLADLERIPTLLLRPGPAGLIALGDRAAILVHYADPAGAETLIAADSAGTAAAFYIGAAPHVTEAMRDRWKRDVAGEGDASAVIVDLWSRPEALQAKTDLLPGGTVRVDIVQKGRLISRVVVPVVARRFLDVLVDDRPEQAGGQ